MITFTLAMHGPFHVSTGTPDEGMDSPIDLACPLPSTSLKGLLRAEATERLEKGGVIKMTQSAVVLENLIGQFLYGKAAEGEKK